MQQNFQFIINAAVIVLLFVSYMELLPATMRQIRAIPLNKQYDEEFDMSKNERQYPKGYWMAQISTHWHITVAVNSAIMGH